ncbi:tyrosine-protein kinase receptor Tie-1-like [Ostrea edulis]|uniref:tyrosine-protein kinase receptor Tie-1-like n=1 Tax=Ostrea edulis TaxID=37623 RepID=UPI0024AF17D7|nr:tyrosine-protein kinase receptor Tie-1-like [Ostrea edulis]
MFIKMAVHIVIVFWSLSFLHPRVSATVCPGENGPTCCYGYVGYVWNETIHNCTSCMPGFFGKQCASSCRYPYYGFQCGLHCNCSEEECHHQHGCRRSYGDCDPGLHGPYCESTCPFPGFGKECQMTCECKQPECNPTTGCILDSSSPVSPLTITDTYPLNKADEHLNELDVESNSCRGNVNVPAIKGNTTTLKYAILGLGVVCCVFLIFYIGLHIVFHRYRPTFRNKHEQSGV